MSKRLYVVFQNTYNLYAMTLIDVIHTLLNFVIKHKVKKFAH